MALIRSNQTQLSKAMAAYFILHLPLCRWILKKFCILVFADAQWVNNLGHTINITHTVVQCTFMYLVDALFCMLELFCNEVANHGCYGFFIYNDGNNVHVIPRVD